MVRFWDVALTRGRCLLEGSAYFDLSVKRFITYWRVVLISGFVLLTGNMVIKFGSFKNLFQ